MFLPLWLFIALRFLDYSPTLIVVRVYNIGVEVRRGTGRYQDTNMVMFVPYNKIVNKSSYRLAFTQKHLTTQVS